MLSLTASLVNSLGKDVFAVRWPELRVRWGIEHDEEPNANVCLSEDGHAHIVVTTGACRRIARIGALVSTGKWLEEVLYPRLFSAALPPRISAQKVGEITHLLGLAALIGHELGHVLDGYYIQTANSKRIDVLVAEEISADGHAILAGLAIVEAWATDLDHSGTHSKDDLLRLGACLLVLANAVIDHIEFGASWQASPDQTHPPGVQRLLGACVHVNDHFMSLQRGFGITAFITVIAALADVGIYNGPTDDEALAQLVKDYDAEVIEIQFRALQETLKARQEF
ncbi:MAG: hypothetical protein ACTHOC_04365 [Luteimonas sp.]